VFPSCSRRHSQVAVNRTGSTAIATARTIKGRETIIHVMVYLLVPVSRAA
jgi:hypothetical protein